jgi:Schwannomin-interacting protein 1
LSQYQNKTSAANTLKDTDVHEDFSTKQARLQAEAKLALAQVCSICNLHFCVVCLDFLSRMFTFAAVEV